VTLGHKLAATGTIHIELETLLHEHNMTIERCWPTEHGQDMRDKKEPLLKERIARKKM